MKNTIILCTVISALVLPISVFADGTPRAPHTSPTPKKRPCAAAKQYQEEYHQKCLSLSQKIREFLIGLKNLQMKADQAVAEAGRTGVISTETKGMNGAATGAGDVAEKAAAAEGAVADYIVNRQGEIYESAKDAMEEYNDDIREYQQNGPKNPQQNQARPYAQKEMKGEIKSAEEILKEMAHEYAKRRHSAEVLEGMAKRNDSNAGDLATLEDGYEVETDPVIPPGAYGGSDDSYEGSGEVIVEDGNEAEVLTEEPHYAE